MSFEAGNVVVLKSGGPPMTVEKTGIAAISGQESVWCTWFEKVGPRQQLQRETFPTVVLEKYEPFVGSISF